MENLTKLVRLHLKNLQKKQQQTTDVPMNVDEFADIAEPIDVDELADSIEIIRS